MRLRSWLDAVAKRHAYTRSPRRRRCSPKRSSLSCYVQLSTETLEPRQLLTANAFDPDSELISAEATGSLSGFKWHDSDGDGNWDTDEAGLSGWTIYIDANENGSLDSGEVSTITGSDGSYQFEGLAPGNYTIGEVLQEGWQQTYPDSLGGDSDSVDISTWTTPEILLDTEYSSGELIVKLLDDSSVPGVLGDLRSLQETMGGTTLATADDLGFELWSIEGDVKDAIAQWGDDPSFQYIQPNYTITVDATTPNDSQFNQLWGLHNTGQSGGTYDADIDAVEAWDIQTGGSVVVGVIDTGIDYTHPDLVSNIWTNPGEIAGNNIDDDGNGYIDDIHGYDFAYNDGDPMDVNSHGTHVAGTIAAAGNNSQGVVGVNWSAQLMALKFLGDNGSGSTFNAVRAVEYATMMGVRITNNSWGGGGYSQALYNAIAAADDALFIAAAGNSGTDNDVSPHYPANYDLDNVISVASTTRNDTLSGFSCYGATTVDLAAPGSSIYSTVPGNSYASYSGTSMATPHVAGVAAMVMAEDPNLSAAEVKQVILDSVDPLPALDGRVLTGGRLNAYNTLQNLGVPGTHNVTLDWNQDVSGLNFGGMRYNRRPIFNDANFTIPEAETVGTVVGRLEAFDPEQAAISFTIVTNPDIDADGTGAFAIYGDQLIVQDSGDLEYEVASQLNLKIAASDGEKSALATITVQLSDINDQPSAVFLVNQLDALPDDADTRTSIRVADIQVTDDALGTNTLSLGGANAVDFDIQNGSLYLKEGSILNRDIQSSYTVTVSASDTSLSGSTAVTTEMTVTVTDGTFNIAAIKDSTANLLSGGSFDNVNTGDTWRAASSIPGWNDSGVVEVWGPGFVNRVIPGRNEGAERGVVIELDYDNNNIDWIEQSIETNDGSQYIVLIDALGRIGSGASDDFELQWNNNTFVAATTAEMSRQGWQTFGGLVDGTGASDTLRISETAAGNDGFGPVIDNVRLYQAAVPSIDEHTPGGTEVTHILVSMRDGTSHSNLRLADDGGGRFALDAESGLITTTRSLDYESDPTSYRLTVAVDTDAGTHLQYLTVTLNETNQGPTAVDLVNRVSSISEAADTSSPVRVADIQITDDGAGTNVVSLTGSDADQFEVIGDSLYLRADRSLDYETQSSYSVTVNVIDQVVGSPVTAEAVMSVDELDDILDSLTREWDQFDHSSPSPSEGSLWSEWDEIDLLFD